MRGGTTAPQRFDKTGCVPSDCLRCLNNQMLVTMLTVVCGGLVAFAIGRKVVEACSLRWGWLWILVAACASVPALLFALHYLPLFDDWRQFIEFRAIHGTEFLAIGAGFLGGTVDYLARPRWRFNRWSLPALLCLGLAVPYLKPVLRPLNLDKLEDKWEGATCLQSTLATCGPASAATILRSFGSPTTERELANAAQTSATGTESWYLIRALRTRGFPCKVRTRVRSLEGVNLPAIAGVYMPVTRTGHFVAVLGMKKDRWIVADPLTGRQEYSNSELADAFQLTGFFIEVALPAR